MISLCCFVVYAIIYLFKQANVLFSVINDHVSDQFIFTRTFFALSLLQGSFVVFSLQRETEPNQFVSHQFWTADVCDWCVSNYLWWNEMNFHQNTWGFMQNECDPALALQQNDCAVSSTQPVLNIQMWKLQQVLILCIHWWLTVILDVKQNLIPIYSLSVNVHK